MEVESQQKQSLQNEITDLMLKQQEKEEKKNDDDANDVDKGLKEDMMSLAVRMNDFNLKYDGKALSMIYDQDPDALLVEQDIDNTALRYKHTLCL